MEECFAVELTLAEAYRQAVDFGLEGVPALQVDEGPPLGAGDGPRPVQVLAAAVGSCLTASLAFCARRAHLPLEGIRTRVEGTLVRNERGRLRVGGLRIVLEPELGGDPERLARCAELFEDFCIVGNSVQEGIPLDVRVEPVGAAVAAAEPALAGMAL